VELNQYLLQHAQAWLGSNRPMRFTSQQMLETKCVFVAGERKKIGTDIEQASEAGILPGTFPTRNDN